MQLRDVKDKLKEKYATTIVTIDTVVTILQAAVSMLVRLGLSMKCDSPDRDFKKNVSSFLDTVKKYSVTA